jgi:DNA-binding CsgD family transcriptional regulator
MATAAAGRERERSVRIAHEAIEGGRLAAATASGLPYPSMALIWSDEVDVAEAAWQVALARAGSAGSQLEAALARCYLAICANARGDRAAAEPLARAALDAVLEARVPAGPNPIAPLAEAMVARGAASVAVALVEEHLDEITRTSVSYPIALFNRGRARMAAGDTGGLADVLAAGRRMVAEGAGNPAVAPWRSVAGTWLVAHGDVERGSQLVSEELALATGFGAPSAIGIALTAASSIADGADSVATAERAVRTLERSPARGALAEAHACHGRALACAGAHVEAREPLRLALDLAHRLGALALAERTRAELVAAGARPRRPALTGPAALTPSEERVARLAATGRSSSAIADELVVSVRTVDMHLSRTYRKLGIDGREELRAALDA